MAVEFLTILAGQSVSSAFELDRSDRLLMVAVPSHAAVGWGLQFQATPSGPFVPLGLDLTGLSVVSFTGGRWLTFPNVPTNMGRIFTSSATIATCSLQLVEIPK